MPRTGGVYSPPAGTKGTPNTTIQSVPYNSFVDDLTADANAARPVTAGGTGATSASGARTALGTDDAGNITTGTFNDARLPLTQSGKVFTSSTFLKGSASRWWGFIDNTDILRGALGYDPALAGLFMNLHDATGTFVTGLSLRQNGAITWGGNTVWHAGNDGAGSGLDADLLDANDSSFYRNASNINAGTMDDARLPITQAGKVFTTSALLKGTVSRWWGFVDNSDILRGSVGYNPTTSTIFLNLHDGAGAFVTGLALSQAGSIAWGGNTVWHSGNDGTGSGLDADRLRSLLPDFNVNPNTVPTRGGSSEIQAAYVYNPATGVTFGSDGNIYGGTFWGAAGGLYNWLNANKAGVYTASTRDELNFPIGHTVLVSTSNSYDRNVAVTLYLNGTAYYSPTVSGTALSGTWRSRGNFTGQGYAFERVS
ncbi:hypothetical protein [Ensifer sp. PDNC004]|uniref:hypothetical protein n=1 Tax=Ensifer sp. PDNC004 TaxID=2811423 RepID=UPI001FEEF7E2|nr:hypothetical protein [Ensifer sp. PDNC004]